MSFLLVYLLCILLNVNGNILYAADEEVSVDRAEEQTPEQAEEVITDEEDVSSEDVLSDDPELDVQVDEQEDIQISSEETVGEPVEESQDEPEATSETEEDETLSESEETTDSVDEVNEEDAGSQDVQDESEEQPSEKVEEPEPEGIDTVDINEPEGNWLFKRIWWEKSKDLFGKIRDKVDKIVESRMHFFQERVRLDRELLDPFYVDIGLDRGALQSTVNNLLDTLKSEREKDGTLDEQELELYNRLLEEKVTLEQLGQAVTSVQQLDASLDEALNKLMEQINLARSYEREAWRLLNEIAEELSDKKAREHYYAIATLWRNVKEIASYIEGAFGQHFIQLSRMSIENVQNINQAIAELEQKGIEIKASVEAKQDEDLIEDNDEDDDEFYAPKQKETWLSWLWNTFTGWFGW